MFPLVSSSNIYYLSSKEDVYTRLMRLEDHNELRRVEEAELWAYHARTVTAFCRDTLRLAAPEAEVWAVLGKMFTNCGDLELHADHARGEGQY